jgi:SAM-dependent methyltransferase
VSVRQRAREAAKLAAEQVLWGRVELQRRLPTIGVTGPIPPVVPPTALLHSEEEWRNAVAACRRLRLPLHHQPEKNWDALGAVSAVLDRFGRDAAVLDAGSARYSSILPWLRLYGLSRLLGINLEFGREVRHGPVRFRHGDVTRTGLPPDSIDAVTCMSVIEHGVPVDPFMAETARILKSGGLLSLSTDYDRQPPDTTGLLAYGQPVRIFGPGDIRQLVANAEAHGLRLIGDLDLDHDERPVHWRRMGLHYTFILLSFARA